MIDIAEQMGPDDLLLLGLTGGCSALMGYPVEGTTLEDLQEATDVMLKAGMWVMDINDIRGHLSRMSRGRLGQHIHGAKILCFEIWDAVGLDDITDYTEPVPSCVRLFLRQGGQSHGTGLRGPAGGVSDAGRHHYQDPG